MVPTDVTRTYTTDGSARSAFGEIHNYLAGQFVGATRPEVLLDEVLKCLFCRFLIESGECAAPTAEDAFEYATQVRAVFARVREKFPELYPSGTELMLDPSAISHVMRAIDFPLLAAETDPIGDAFEVFAGSESRGRSGQFFTPRSVTDLLVDALDPQPGETMVDPACGAGGFMASVVRHLRANGLGAEELGRVTSAALEGVEKDNYLASLARAHVAILSGGHGRITCSDSLAALVSGSDQTFRPDGYDLVLTNPPFGKKIVAGSAEVLSHYEVGRKWKKGVDGRLVPTGEVRENVPPQVLFLELCVRLLKPGGRLGIVVPESMLSNKTYLPAMTFLSREFETQAVIGMPEALFKTSGKGGTHTKTCLLVGRRRGGDDEGVGPVFMAEARHCGQDSRARAIPLNDLPGILESLRAWLRDGVRPAHGRAFLVRQEELSAGILAPRYYDPEAVDGLGDLEVTHQLLTFGRLVEEGVLAVATGDEVGKLAYGTGSVPFIRTSDLSGWEIKADAKHGVDESYYTALGGKQDVRAGDILMVKDGTYLIGTCAMVTESDSRLLYQSHLFKIRVREPNAYGLDPYVLLAILTSSAVQRQIRAKQFTADIIDSLGDRIHELVLPVPRDESVRARVSEAVRQAVEHRERARQLAEWSRKAVAAVEDYARPEAL